MAAACTPVRTRKARIAPATPSRTARRPRASRSLCTAAAYGRPGRRPRPGRPHCPASAAGSPTLHVSFGRAQAVARPLSGCHAGGWKRSSGATSGNHARPGLQPIEESPMPPGRSSRLARWVGLARSRQLLRRSLQRDGSASPRSSPAPWRRGLARDPRRHRGAALLQRARPHRAGDQAHQSDSRGGRAGVRAASASTTAPPTAPESSWRRARGSGPSCCPATRGRARPGGSAPSRPTAGWWSGPTPT